MTVFVDTNILLDVIAQRESFYEPAALVWGRVESGKVRGLVSAISFNNVFYIVRRFADRRHAAEAVRLLRSVFDVVPVNARVIDAAIECRMNDFEDAIQYQCALQSRARYLITRNPRDFPAGGPAVVSPDEFLALTSP